MALSEFERPRAEQVLNDIFDSYYNSLTYHLVTEVDGVGMSPIQFAHDRRNKVLPLISMPEWTSERRERDSFLSEWIVLLGLKKTLAQADLNLELAPPHLESGTKGRRGVDLIASKKILGKDVNTPVFAINVKLQRLKYNKRVDTYKYDNVLGCPAIELSLGDFLIQTKKSGQVSIIPWLRQVATPNITNSGQIPDFLKWQKYLIKKVEDTVSHYMIKTDDFVYGDYEPKEHETKLFPKTEAEFVRFYDNLSCTFTVFRELRSQLDNI